jgi:hypothetical protein
VNNSSPYNKEYNDDNYIVNFDYNNYNINKNKASEKSINVNDYRNHIDYNLNNDLDDISYDKNFSFKTNNKSNKFIKFNDGEILLYHKKNKPNLMQEDNSYDKEKIKSRQKHKQKTLKNQYNTTNKIINHFILSNLNKNKKLNSCINDNNPIRINYNEKAKNFDITPRHDKNCDITSGNDNSITSCENNNKTKKIQQKINNMKKKVGFEGNNEEFIEYLRILKIKADITYLVENIFNNKENEDENMTKMCYKKLENLIENKNNEEKNLLNIYQYLVEQLLKTNNISKNNFLNDI